MLCLAAFVCVTSTGCIALGLPSERFHDPEDHGGLLGDWKKGTHHDQHLARCLNDECFDLPMDDHGGVPKAPEVPWPRYHPIPTRPVFGPP